MHGKQQTWSEGINDTVMKGGGNTFPFKEHPYRTDLYTFTMQGKNLLRLAKRRAPEFLETFFREAGCSPDQVDLFIPHQASKAGLMLFDALFHVPENRVMKNLPEYGNCIAASLPLALCEAIETGRLQRGQTCLLIGTSAGFSVGGALFRY